MSGELRAGLGADRLQRIGTMRLMRVVSAGVLSLVALLTWMTAEPSAQRGYGVVASTTVTRGEYAPRTSVSDAERQLTSRTAKQAARIVVRHLLFARARGADGDGDATLTLPLVPSHAELLDDIAHSVRAHLQRYAQRHLPYGDPSSFDATAPPTRDPRNG